MKKKKQVTQLDILKEYYRSHPHQNISHPQIVDWAVKTWKK